MTAYDGPIVHGKVIVLMKPDDPQAWWNKFAGQTYSATIYPELQYWHVDFPEGTARRMDKRWLVQVQP